MKGSFRQIIFIGLNSPIKVADKLVLTEKVGLCSLLLSLATLILEILWQTFYITYLQVN